MQITKDIINEFIATPTRKSMKMSGSFARLTEHNLTIFAQKYKEYNKVNIIDYINKSDYSQNSKYIVAQMFCRFGREYELLNQNDINKIKQCFPCIRKTWSDDVIKENDVVKIVEMLLNRAQIDEVKNYRDASAVIMLSSFGMRVGQLQALKHSDVSFEDGKIKLWLKKQKHNSFRTEENNFRVLLPRDTKIGDYFISDIITKYKSLLPANSTPFIYGRDYHLPITTCGIEMIIKNIGNKIGLKGLHPHSFRHYVGTNLCAKYGIAVAGAMLNHSSLNTTKMYIQRENLLEVIR